MSMKNFIGNRTRDLPTYSVVPQPTAPPSACPVFLYMTVNNSTILIVIQPSYLRSQITVIIVKRIGKTEHAAFTTVKKYTTWKLVWTLA
jgi:hypothetical protein